MSQNHLRTVGRRLQAQPAYMAINVIGLALGLAACLLIARYVQYELSYDRFHRNADRLVRIVQPENAVTPARLAPALAETFPGVVGYARLVPTLGDVLIRTPDDLRFYEQRFYFADSSTLDLFTFPLVQGDAATALDEAGTVVISENVAHRYFGTADPLGQTLIFDVGFQAELRVTGILRDPPRNAHLRPDFLASMATFRGFDMLDFESWDQPFFQSYVLLSEKQSSAALEASLPAFFERHTGEARQGYRVQPIRDIHLHSKLRGEIEPPGEMRYVYTFAAVALLVLLLAVVNFVNLATARSAHRAREVGLRKVLGASRGSLVVSFLLESVVMAVLALLLAWPLALLLLPTFNAVVDTGLTLPLAGIAPALLLAVGIGMLAGAYPALVLSGFAPQRALMPKAASTSHGWLRRALVIVQFTVGVALTTGVFVVRQQLAYLQSKDLGFDDEQVVVVAARMYGHSTAPVPFEAMMQAFAEHPGVAAVAATGDVPGATPRQQGFALEGQPADADLGATTWNLHSMDYGTLEALGVRVVAGRSFDESRPADAADAFILNEAAVQAAAAVAGEDWRNPVGMKIDRYVRNDGEWVLVKPGRVIGMVADFHYQSLHNQIEPLVIQVSRATRDHLIVRLHSAEAASVLAHLEAVWTTFQPERPFEYYFLDDAFARLYRAERRVAALADALTTLGLFIACLGLYGLTAFTTEQRRKEIGIRKTLGATSLQVTGLLTAEITRLVLVATVLAAPLAYVALQQWLGSFAFQIRLGPGVFVLAGAGALTLALLTVSYQSIRAACADPVDALRHE